MIDVTEARKGVTIELDGQLYFIVGYQHIKIGRGSAQVRLKLRNIRARHTVERTFQSGERLKRAQVEERPAQYLYQDADFYYFMDQESFDQITISGEQMGDGLGYLKEGLTVEISRYEGEIIGVALPINVDLRVTETGPSFRGDTSQGGGKPATLETGIAVQVPFFVETGDTVRIDTRTGEYLERVS